MGEGVVIRKKKEERETQSGDIHVCYDTIYTYMYIFYNKKL